MNQPTPPVRRVRAAALRPLCAFGCLLALAVADARAQDQDIVYLKSGTDVQGEIVAEGEEGVTVRFSGGTLLVPRAMILRVVRRATTAAPEVQTAVAGLDRLQDREEFLLIRYRGRIVGTRTMRISRDVKGGVAGYSIAEHTAFNAAGKDPDCEVQDVVFVGPDLRVREFSWRRYTPGGERYLEGKVEDGEVIMRERIGGREQTRRTLFREDARFWLPLRASLHVEPSESFAAPVKLFDPDQGSFTPVTLSREFRRVQLLGRAIDATVWRIASPKRATEVWLDAAGLVQREEIGTAHMVAEATTRDALLAFARGDLRTDETASALRFSSDADGFCIERPDPTWEFAPGKAENGVAVSLLHATHRASVDVLTVDDPALGGTVESLALRLFSRMQSVAEGVTRESLEEGLVSGRPGLVFTARARKNGTDIKTLGALLCAEGRSYAVLCAAPVSDFDATLPEFRRIVLSFEVRKPAASGTNAFRDVEVMIPELLRDPPPVEWSLDVWNGIRRLIP